MKIKSYVEIVGLDVWDDTLCHTVQENAWLPPLFTEKCSTNTKVHQRKLKQIFHKEKKNSAKKKTDDI